MVHRRGGGAFPPESRTAYKAPLADKHTELRITSPQPARPCFLPPVGVTKSVFPLLLNFFPSQLKRRRLSNSVPVIFSPSWMACKHVGLLVGPWREQIMCLWGGVLEWLIQLPQNRALISPTRTGKKGDTLTSTLLTRTHCPIEGPNRKALSLPHHFWGFLWPNKKEHSCLMIMTIWRV